MKKVRSESSIHNWRSLLVVWIVGSMKGVPTLSCLEPISVLKLYHVHRILFCGSYFFFFFFSFR